MPKGHSDSEDREQELLADWLGEHRFHWRRVATMAVFLGDDFENDVIIKETAKNS